MFFRFISAAACQMYFFFPGPSQLMQLSAAATVDFEIKLSACHLVNHFVLCTYQKSLKTL